MSDPTKHLGRIGEVLAMVAPDAKRAADSIALFALGIDHASTPPIGVIVSRDPQITIMDGAGVEYTFPLADGGGLARMWRKSPGWPQRVPIEQEIGRCMRLPGEIGGSITVSIHRFRWKLAPYRTGGARRRRAVVRRVRT